MCKIRGMAHRDGRERFCEGIFVRHAIETLEGSTDQDVEDDCVWVERDIQEGES
jgi:hypothetical protein